MEGMPRRDHFKFMGVDEILDVIEGADPSYEYVDPVDRDRFSSVHHGRKVVWVTDGYVVDIPVKNILFMEGNLWYPEHAAALLKSIENGDNNVLQVPAARVYRVMAKDVKQTAKYERDGELDYQLSMTEPWTKAEQGEYYAQLLDGNHRAAAAILAGEHTIPVYISENTRENVRKKDMY